MKRLLPFVLSALLVLSTAVPVLAADPTATGFSFTASTVGASLIQLQGADTDGTALVYAIVAGPSHGALSGLNTSTGTVVYTPTTAYTGADSFTYKVTSGGADSNTATVTLTVTNAKTRIVDTLVDPSANPRTGKVTFILTQKVSSPAGIIPVGASVSAVLSSGQFDVSVYPSSALSPTAYYQVWYESLTGGREPIGVYNIPATSASSITLTPYAVTNAHLAAQYTFLSASSINSLVTGLGSPVVSFNARTGAVTPATNDYTWAQINKSTSSIADITTRSASDLSSGTLPDARFPATLPAASGVNLTALNASNLGSGTVPDARFPSTLPALNGSALTNLNATNLASGTVAPARLGSLTDGAFPYKTSSNLADSPLLRYGAGTVGFGAGTPAAPTTGDQTTGTRVLFLSGASGEHLGMGVESGALWSNVGSANSYKYYWGASSAEKYTLTPTQMLFNTSQTSFTLNYQTSGSTSASALYINTNAATVRIGPNPGADNSKSWDFTLETLRPFADDSMGLGDHTHRISQLFITPGSTQGICLSDGTNCTSIMGGSGDPVGSVLGRPGSLYLRTDGTVYKKNSGTSTGGWQALATVTGTETLTNKTVASPTVTGSALINSSGDGHGSIRLEGSQVGLNSGTNITWHSNSDGTGGGDVGLQRSVQAVLNVYDPSTAGGATLAYKPISPAQITSNQNNYNPGGAAHYLRLNSDASRNITGLTFTAAQVDGQTHVLVNVGSTDIVIKHQDTNSTAGNRFLCSTGADITLTANQMADIWFDATTARWRVSKRN